MILFATLILFLQRPLFSLFYLVAACTWEDTMHTDDIHLGVNESLTDTARFVHLLLEVYFHNLWIDS